MYILETVKETITDTITSIKEFFNEEMTTTRKAVAITCAISALIGIVYGFLISPVKKGIQVNVTTNNGDTYAADDE